MNLLVLDGLPGAGKTTLARQLLVDFKARGIPVGCAFEPVDEWQKSGLFELAKKDPAEYAFTFQMFVYITQYNALRDAYVELNARRGAREAWLICDRDPQSGLDIFAGVNKDLFTEKQNKIITDILETYLSVDPFFGRMIRVFVDTSVTECLRRIEARGRKEEAKIQVEYLASLKKAHENFIDGFNSRINLCLEDGMLRAIIDGIDTYHEAEGEKLVAKMLDLCLGAK